MSPAPERRVQPYIVTHKRERTLASSDPRSEWLVLYREAFATLEDVKDAASDRAQDCAGMDESTAPDVYRAIQVLTQDGGKFTLPNGDVIEVEATTYDRIWDELSRLSRPPAFARVDSTIWADGSVADQRWGDALLAAWNAEHGIGTEEEGD